MRFYVQKRKWWIFGWKTVSTGLGLKMFAENEIVQMLRNDEKEKNTKMVRS